MNDYEKMSEQANEMRKNMIMRKDQSQTDPPVQEGNKYSFTGVMGIILIIIGIVGAVGIVLSFDWSQYSYVKDVSSIYEERLITMKAELTTTLIMAGATLIGNLALGSVLLALDKIIQLLKELGRDGMVE